MVFPSWKIKKVDGSEPTEFERSVAEAVFDLEQHAEFGAALKTLFFSRAVEVKVNETEMAAVVYVPVPFLTAFQKIQTKLVRELEKKLARTVVVVADRRIVAKQAKRVRAGRINRPHSRTLTAVHDSLLEDLVYPVKITGKQTRYCVDSSRRINVFLDPADRSTAEFRLECFSTVYKTMTSKDVEFEFRKL
ncbi:Ribosomal protein S7e [Carpediemonas membranifera]|uniref:40S ribosomal protein S7 n=1 Tax=Carpediemonas membranifera TaxID=201153 RepID=A0A8J6B2U0_9EUKA|nr:Ribosomal protein S7e [Carpediemonas membranifera]|eukprot:KAG9393064.1 Ribosomal protein S7e [Carpediemonas membranifera]